MVGNEWRRRAFQLLEALNEGLAEDDPGVPPNEAALAIGPRLRALGWTGQVAEVRRWFANPGRFTPFLDEVALERALAFDWPVIRTLSRDERAEFYRRLAAMRDPYGAGEDRQWEAFLRRHAYTYRPAGELEVSRRRQAWEVGGQVERQTVGAGVLYWRRAGAPSVEVAA